MAKDKKAGEKKIQDNSFSLTKLFPHDDYGIFRNLILMQLSKYEFSFFAMLLLTSFCDFLFLTD